MNLRDAVEQYLDACKKLEELEGNELLLAQQKKRLGSLAKEAFTAVCLQLNPGETLLLGDGRAVSRTPAMAGDSIYVTKMKRP